MPDTSPRILTVTPNTAIDCLYEVPGLQLGDHVMAERVERVAAGKGINVVRLLAGLDMDALAVGFVGRDEYTWFERSLDALGIATAFVPVAGRTRENITLIDPTAQQETHVRDRGFEVTPDDIERLRDTVARHVAPDTIVVISGSLPPGFETDHLRDLLTTCNECGARTALDTAGAILRSLGTLPLWLAKPNLAELAECLGRADAPPDELLSEARQMTHCENLLISRGADGADLLRRDGRWHGKSTRPIEVLSTVGCGDALLAGFVAATVRDADPPGALREALAAASGAAMQSRPGRVDPAQLDELREAIEVQRQA